MDRNAHNSSVIVPGHNSTDQRYFNIPDCSTLENRSLKSTGVTTEKVYENVVIEKAVVGQTPDH